MPKKKLDPDPIERLPFVHRDESWTPKKGKVSGRVGPVSFWAVRPTGNVAGDCDLGMEYARQALDHIAEHRSNPLLGWVVLDMIANANPEKAAGDDKMVIVGFMSEVAKYAEYGRKILEAFQRLEPGGMIALMKNPRDDRTMMVEEVVYPDAEVRTPL